MHIYEPRDDPVTSDVVLTLSLVCTNWRQSEIQQFVAVHIVTKIDHVQLGRLCRMWVIFVASMSPRLNVLSTFGGLCRIRQNDRVEFNSTLLPVCTGPCRVDLVPVVKPTLLKHINFAE